MSFWSGSGATSPSGDTGAFFVHSPDLLAVLGADGTLRNPNPAWGRLLGRATEQVQGRSFTELLVAEDRGPLEMAIARLRRGEAQAALEARSTLRDGSMRWVHWVLVNAEGRILVCGRDATERKQLEERLRFDALQDAVTGLANRKVLVERLSRLLARAQKMGGRVGVLYVDLHGFSAINERLGHSAGDMLLFSVARRLETSVRPGDLVCRVGGDAFGVVLDGVRGEDDVVLVANRVVSVMESPFLVSAQSVPAGVHLGGVVSRPEDTADEILDEAERRQVRARTDGVRFLARRGTVEV